MTASIARTSRPQQLARAWLIVCCWATLLFCSSLGANATNPADEDVTAQLAHIREVSYRQSWQEAQNMLDEMADRVPSLTLRQQAEYQLLQARHLTLADRSPEALALAADLLAMPLESDQRLAVLQFASNVAVLMREYEAAFEYLTAALAVEPEVENPASRMDTFNMAGYMFGRVGEHARAMHYGQRSVNLAVALEDRTRECVARQRLAPVLKWAGLNEAAEQEYTTAIAVCEAIGNALFVGVLQHGLADLLRRLGRLDEARRYAEASIERLDNAVFPLGEKEAQLVLVEILHDLGDQDALASESLDTLANYFRENELWDQQARLELLLSAQAETAGQTARALLHLRQYIDARERFLGRDRAMRLAYLEVEFDSRFKDQEIELLAESARRARLEQTALEQQKQARTVILLLSGTILILLFALLFGALRSRKHYRHLSRHDGLSGLSNQTWFLHRAERLLEQSRQRPDKVFFIMADIDYFKLINDRFGHQVGDSVIGQTARRLQAAFGDQALVGRLGGEEFGVVLLSDSLDDIIQRIERFQQSAEDSVRHNDPPFTLSFGIAQRAPDETLDALRARADEALYQAKNAGRNCHVFSDASSSLA